MANFVIGLYSPFKYGLEEWNGYSIRRFKNNIRFMEIIEDRDYGANGQICPLYFNGASSYFKELPKSDDINGISEVYRYMETRNTRRASVLFMTIGIGINNRLKKLVNKLQSWLYLRRNS